MKVSECVSSVQRRVSGHFEVLRK